MPRQDQWGYRVVVFKLWIVVEVRLEKFGLLSVNISWLDGCKDTELLGIFHFPRNCCFVQ